MKWIRLFFGLLLGMFWVAPVVFAQIEEEVTLLERVVVTATKAETPMKEVTRAVTVIPADRLNVDRGGFVSDVFSNVPETLVRRTGAIGRTTTVVIRGSNAQQVHVTIDGSHVASPTLGSFDFSNFSPINLERAEIMRGPGGTLYGSDAVGGVINFVTLRGEGPFRFSQTQEFGTLMNTFREVSSMQGAAGKWHLSGAISRIDSDGLSDNDQYENLNISARVGLDVNDQTTLDVFFRHLFGVVGIDDGGFRPDPNRTSRSRDSIGSIKLESQVKDWWSTLVRLSTSVGNVVSNDPSNSLTDSDSLFKLDTERYGAEWMNRFTPVEWDTVTVGFEFEDREADNRSFDKTQTTWSLYIQNEWRPLDPLTVVTGVRYFRESAFGSDEVVEASAAYFVEPLNLKIRGGFGQGFRAPSLNDLFFPGFGNPDLVPEKSETFEVGADQVLWDGKATWSGTLFRTNVNDLIQFTSTSTGFLPLNIGKTRMEGVELDLELKPLDHWTLTGAYTHVAANVRPSEEELLRIPKNTFSFTAEYSPSSKWEARLEGVVVSSREESTFPDRNKTKGYLKLDFFAQVRFHPQWKGYIRIENLADRNYSEVLGFPAPGTVFNFGVTWQR